MPTNYRLLIVAAALAVAGCSTTREVKVPERVYINVDRFVPVPETLTEPCEIAMPKNMSVAEAVRIAKARRTSLEKCNADKAAIRKLGSQPT